MIKYEDNSELPITTVYVTFDVHGRIIHNKYCIGRFPENRRQEFLDLFQIECTLTNEQFWHDGIKVLDVKIISELTYQPNFTAVVFRDKIDTLVLYRIRDEIEKKHRGK